MRLVKSASAPLFVVAVAAMLIAAHGIPRARTFSLTHLQETRLPVLYWQGGIETAGMLNEAEVTQIAVPPALEGEWRRAGFKVLAVSGQDLERREKLIVPRIAGRVDVASATRRPWIDLNGWRFVRSPSGKFLYEIG